MEESFFLVKARICCLWVVLSWANWSNPSLFITTINLIYCQQQNLRLSPRSTLSRHFLLGLKSGSVQQILPICITKAWLRTVTSGPVRSLQNVLMPSCKGKEAHWILIFLRGYVFNINESLLQIPRVLSLSLPQGSARPCSSLKCEGHKARLGWLAWPHTPQTWLFRESTWGEWVFPGSFD